MTESQRKMMQQYLSGTIAPLRLFSLTVALVLVITLTIPEQRTFPCIVLAVATVMTLNSVAAHDFRARLPALLFATLVMVLIVLVTTTIAFLYPRFSVTFMTPAYYTATTAGTSIVMLLLLPLIGRRGKRLLVSDGKSDEKSATARKNHLDRKSQSGNQSRSGTHSRDAKEQVSSDS